MCTESFHLIVDVFEIAEKEVLIDTHIGDRDGSAWGRDGVFSPLLRLLRS